MGENSEKIFWQKPANYIIRKTSIICKCRYIANVKQIIIMRTLIKSIFYAIYL